MSTKSKISSALALLWAGFIFSNSLKIGEASSSMSGGFVEFIMNILQKIGFTPTNDVVTVFVRKSGHIIEYLILGILITLVLTLSQKKIKFYLFNVLFLCLATAVIDEFIQTFIAGRTGMVGDIIIDFIGACLGVIIIAFATRNKFKKRRRY